MTDIEIPLIPAGLVLLANFFTPYIIAIATAPFWPKAAKRVVAVGISLLFTALVLLVAHFLFSFPLPAWGPLLLIGVLMSQTTYAAILKGSADDVQQKTGVGSGKVIDATGTLVGNTPVVTALDELPPLPAPPSLPEEQGAKHTASSQPDGTAS
jgi:hypothetical protein